jgi:tetratricopeptide (TPR) repeat protein
VVTNDRNSLTRDEFCQIIGFTFHTVTMPNSQSNNPVRPPEPRGDADREARIEQLLLTGLDHYFAGQYERAISVWTRVVFLERHHDRARAYIERARSAQAERHRESEELLHVGMAAYNAGDIDRARSLLTRAVEQGNDAADVFLDRLNRVDSSGSGADLWIDPLPALPIVRQRRVAPPAKRQGWIAGALAMLVVAAAMLLGGLPIGAWLSDLQMTTRQVSTSGSPVGPTKVEPLPIVRASEVDVVRARELYADGRLVDALRALDGIGIADPHRPEADALRADLQRDLLTAVGVQSPASVPAQTGGLP